MERLMREDAERRTARELAELVELSKPAHARGTHDPYLVSRGITGEPTDHNRTYGMRAHGSRAGNRTWHDVSTRDNRRPPEMLPNIRPVTDGTVTVTYADGSRAIVPQSVFTAERERRQTESRAAEILAVRKATRLALLESAGFIGNVE